MAASVFIKKVVCVFLVFSILWSDFSFVFAQEEKVPVGRIERLLKEIKDTTEKLDQKIDQLNVDLAECACSKARSVCYGTKPFGGLFSFLETPQAQKEKEERVYCALVQEEAEITKDDLKAQVKASIDETDSTISRLERLEETLKNIPGTEKIRGEIKKTVSSLKEYKDFLSRLKVEEIAKEKVESVLSEIENKVKALENTLENLKHQILDLPENIKKQIESEIENALSQITSQIDSILSVFDAFKSFGNFLTMLLGCRKVGTAGWVVERVYEDKIKKDKTEIKTIVHRLEFQKNLLKKELEWGFDWTKIKDLKLFSDSVNSLFEKIDKEKEMANKAETLSCSIRNCVEVCNLGTYFQLPKLCFGHVGEQKPFKIIVTLGIRMPKEWKLGKIKAGVKMRWPKIKIGDLKVSGLKIKFHPKIEKTTLPLGAGGRLNVTLPQISFLTGARLRFVCPPKEGDYLHDLGAIAAEDMTQKEFCFWSRIFNYLSLHCQLLFFGFFHQAKAQSDERFEGCFSPQFVHRTIIEKCNEILKECEGDCTPFGCQCDLPEICYLPYKSVGIDWCAKCERWLGLDCCQKVNYLPFTEKREKEGKVELSRQAKEKIEGIAKTCAQKIKEKDWCGIDLPVPSSELTEVFSQNELSALRALLTLYDEKLKEIPKECRLLPLILGEYPLEREITSPWEGKWNVEVGEEGFYVTAQDVKINFSSRILGCEPKVTLPKLKLPYIKIPDLKLGSFALPPILYIHWPEIITEDLDFRPERKLKDLPISQDFGYDTAYELCDINRCLGKIENLFPLLRLSGFYFNFPTITLPEMTIHPRGDLKIPWIKVSLGDIKLPTVSFPGWAINFGHFIDLSLNFPSFHIPLPQFVFKIKLDIDIKGLLLNLFSKVIGKFFKLPQGCVGLNFFLPIPLVIDFGTFYIYFPAFHKIRELLGYILCPLTGYCEQLAEKLKGVVDFKEEVEKKVQGYFNEVSGALSAVATDLSDKIKVRLEEKAKEFEKDLTEHINQNAKIVENKLEIPPFEKDYGEIDLEDVVKEGSLRNVLCQKFPDKCPPPELDLQQVVKKEPPQAEFDYDLPTIDLSKYSYQKDFPIAFGTLQTLSFKLQIPAVKCDSGAPTGKAKDLAPSTKDVTREIGKLIKDLVSQLKE